MVVISYTAPCVVGAMVEREREREREIGHKIVCGMGKVGSK